MPDKVKITVWGYRCERCAHEWVPIRAQAPRVCPKCKSPYWDRERQRRPAQQRAGDGQGEGEVGTTGGEG